MSDVQLQYLVAHSAPPDELARRLFAETGRLGGVAQMQISADEGAFLHIATHMVGARRAVEVGTFTGYSALCIARALPDDGTLLCCDVSEEWTAIARRYWEEAGVASKIDLRIAPALETLRSFPSEPVWDLAFIDADKQAYRAYWEQIVPRIRAGGVILVDNVFQGGRVVQSDSVADPASTDQNVVAMRSFNDMVVADDRVEVVMLPIRDGVTLAWKR